MRKGERMEVQWMGGKGRRVEGEDKENGSRKSGGVKEGRRLGERRECGRGGRGREGLSEGGRRER